MQATLTIDAKVHRAQAIYNPFVLRFYDQVLYRMLNPMCWGFPDHTAIGLYDRFVRDTHLEVGVGTGYLLDHCQFPSARPRITLLDLNRHCLERTARRIHRYNPRTVYHNAYAPLPDFGVRYGSVGLNYVLHCVPGTMSDKAVIVKNLAARMREDGVLFGSTILQDGSHHNLLSRGLCQLYNRIGMFNNRSDTLPELASALEASFRHVAIRRVGTVGVFAASNRPVSLA